MLGASAVACLYTAMQLSIRPPLLRSAVHRSKTEVMEVMTFSKSKSGKKSIPTYTASTHHDFPADIAAKFAETPKSLHKLRSSTWQKPPLTQLCSQCTLEAENGQNATKLARIDSQGPMILPLIGETESDRWLRLKGGKK